MVEGKAKVEYKNKECVIDVRGTTYNEVYLLEHPKLWTISCPRADVEKYLNKIANGLGLESISATNLIKNIEITIIETGGV